MVSKTEAQERLVLLHAKWKHKQKKIVRASSLEDLDRGDPNDSNDASNSIPVHPKSAQDTAFLQDVLLHHFVFYRLSEEERTALVGALERCTVEAGEILIHEGDTSSFHFYILHCGVVKVLSTRSTGREKEDVDDSNQTEPPPPTTHAAAAGTEIMRLDDAGQSFGELELLYDVASVATVQAVQACVVWKLPQAVFSRVVRRFAVQREIQRPLRDVAPALFDGFDDDDDTLLQQWQSLATTVDFPADHALVSSGDAAHAFYVIVQGCVRLFPSSVNNNNHNHQNIHSINKTALMDQMIRAGDWFGGHDLETGDLRLFNAQTVTPVTCWLWDADAYQQHLVPHLKPRLDQQLYRHFLRALPVFANTNTTSTPITDDEYRRLTEALQPQSYQAGDVIVAQGDDRRDLYIVRSGHVRLFDGVTDHHLVRGDVFGDKWLLHHHHHHHDNDSKNDDWSMRAALRTAVAEEDGTRVFCLSADDLKAALGIDDKSDDNALALRLGTTLPFQYQSSVDTSLQQEDLARHAVLGRGEFAVVYMVQHVPTQETYALKTLSKLHLLEHPTNAIAGTRHEKEVMASVHHPFIMRLYNSFQDDRYVYLLLPFFQGGELFRLIYGKDKYGLAEADAIFYGACVVEAIAHLHSRHIVHRDLKPDNVMINSKGYAVLIDMGLAKFVVGKTYSMVGTPSYIAPEVLIGNGHNHAVDYWALACLLYEMMEGTTPFYWEGATQKDEFEAIVRNDYVLPKSFGHSPLKDLLEKLLVLDPAARLGSSTNNDVMNHPWFDSIHFRRLRREEIPSPWVPSQRDASNFNVVDPDEIEPPYRELTLQEQELFHGF